MLVDITAVEATTPIRVRFRCEAGAGSAAWTGSVPPAVGSSHDVELEHELPLRIDAPMSLIDGSNSICQLAAKVEAVDEHLVLTLRVGSGVMLAQLSPGETPPARDTEVNLVGVALSLWPSGI